MTAVTVVAAIARNGVIGRGGDLPWHLPDDLRRFKQLTMGHLLVMGRRTFASIGRALPGRRTVVLTRGAALDDREDVLVARSLDEALAHARPGEDACVVGGAEVYRAALPVADRLCLTHVDADVEGDVRFPPVDWSAWLLVREEYHPADPRHAHAFTFREYHAKNGRKTIA